ncbi:2-oxo-4-hydroxy-4-carboxy-5-ureidoimidazoline (OHCU) decarboxylase [Klebsiella pneumoniae]|uniref:2-oxo-4-hydroxy-4-carboxy-5-ureidoimidazoline decarboxylase n=1 Tax=Klebsiella pneumoniae TaxID=573 RepID=A0A377ZUG7_KLEPN|nr:2-oxo-4-hydroxy-4-carboxy-5-ureidoimidazoline (OHCU) decarboxylase [Klebsiella pneumoniae]STU51094.1 2-oxo-4-hydroxy-4-carboxy-5-ureidoimidazoline (OHCU) decarboxylase [Klebsiella pneumoniae]STU85771.1 2-oxo-4-hydroxy-4-carboxy-5-ureidoimidazoline (OHCU) decarboxylase [Klebsiella pneumoniae]
MIALSQFNSLSKDEAAGLLAPCVAIPAWGEILVSLRPFASRHALLQVARKAMANWGEDELNAALSAHPRIGEKPTGSQAHAALSRQEQSSVDSENERLAQALREGNARYEARFGRVFLIRAKGRSGEEMLQALTRRLQHTADEEEQSSVDSENERLAQALREGNARYEARFGRVFLIRAKGRSGEEMLQALTRRLQHTADEEVAEALAQLREITMLRLEGVIGE